jgi:hypothetical protein
MLRPRWVRTVLIVVALVLIGYTVYYRAAIAPELTADRFGVELAGVDSPLKVEVDEGSSSVGVTGGLNGLSQIFATKDALFVRADEVGAQTDAEWVRVRFEDLGTRPAMLDAARLTAELSIGVKDCRALPEDVGALVAVMLAAPGPDARLCGLSFRNTAEAGMVTVDAQSRRPDDLTPAPAESTVELQKLANNTDVLTEVQQLLHLA